MAEGDTNKPPAEGQATEGQGDGGSGELERMREALRKANEEAKKYRLLADEKAKELAALKADVEGGKTDAERMAQQLAELRQRADEADRRALVAEVAQAKGLTPAQAKRLQGATKEELEADADELLSAFKPAAESQSTSDTRPAGRPRENLRPGATPPADSGEQYDSAKFLAAVPRG